MTFRDGWPHQNGWIFGNLCFPKIYVADFCHYKRFFGHVFWKKSATWFSENEGGGAKAVWNFSKNSSLLETPPFPKCYTWLESCGSPLSDGIKKKYFFLILQSVWFSRTLRTDIFLYTEKLSYKTNVPSTCWFKNWYFLLAFVTLVF